MARQSAVRMQIGLVALIFAACTTPQQHGKPIDPAQFARAEARCREEASARYGAAPSESARRDGDTCDAQSWLCRRTQAWMRKDGNPLSTATPRDRVVHRYTQRCLESQGYRAP